MLSTDYNRILIFKEPIFNAALTGHIIRTVKVSDDGGCRVMCYMEPNCVSFNVGPSDDGTRTCNLNNATDDSVSPTSLVDRPNFSYNGAEVNFFPSGLLSFLSSFLLSLLFLPSLDFRYFLWDCEAFSLRLFIKVKLKSWFRTLVQGASGAVLRVVPYRTRTTSHVSLFALVS